MSVYNAAGNQSGDRPDKDRLPAITTHVEPRDQGGAVYIRCEGCGWEVTGTDEERLEHRDGCEHAEEGN